MKVVFGPKLLARLRLKAPSPLLRPLICNLIFTSFLRSSADNSAPNTLSALMANTQFHEHRAQRTEDMRWTPTTSLT